MIVRIIRLLQYPLCDIIHPPVILGFKLESVVNVRVFDNGSLTGKPRRDGSRGSVVNNASVLSQGEECRHDHALDCPAKVDIERKTGEQETGRRLQQSV